MILIDTESGKSKEALIEKVSTDDLKIIKKSKRFKFDWNKEKQYDLYKIRCKDSEEILGLLSIADFYEERWLKINLLESSIENVGSEKKYDKIAGCLIAFSCKLAFVKGYDGCVALQPKTELREHYIKKYGMQNGGLHLFTELHNSEKIIQEYLL